MTKAGLVIMALDAGVVRRDVAIKLVNDIMAAEREECAKVAWKYGWKRVDSGDVQSAAVEITELIRARGTK